MSKDVRFVTFGKPAQPIDREAAYRLACQEFLSACFKGDVVGRRMRELADDVMRTARDMKREQYERERAAA